MTSAGRLRLAELTSGIGALVLGIGLGALLGHLLSAFGLTLLILGAILHGWGMFDKHRIEARAAEVWWAPVLYWTCWGALGLLALTVLVRLAGLL